MPRSRARDRDREPERSSGPSPPSEAFASTLGQNDTDVSLRGVVEGEPGGTGSEAATASESLEVLAETKVPPGRQAELEEVALAIPANGAGLVSLRGLTFGPFTGAVDTTLPFGGASLLEGDVIRVYHRSTDGEAATSRASITLRLF